MSHGRRISAMVAALSVGTACSDNPAAVAPPTGTVLLRLTTPHADDGALVFEVSGPRIDSATAANGSLRLFTRRAGNSTLVGVVAGAVAAGPIVTLHVSDVGASYTARVVEVADRQDLLRASLTGYAVTVAP